MGRGYRIGDQRTISAGAGFPGVVPGIINPAVALANYGQPHEFRRWKVTLHVADPDGNTPALQGSGLRFTVTAKMENEIIPRRVFISVGDAQVIYAPGRSIEILGLNPNTFDLRAHWQVDEETAGLSTWEDREIFTALSAETVLDIPPFCDHFQIYSPGAAAPSARVRGYATGGTVAFDSIVAVPDSGDLSRVPDLLYTITPTGAAPQVHAVRYQCVG